MEVSNWKENKEIGTISFEVRIPMKKPKIFLEFFYVSFQKKYCIWIQQLEENKNIFGNFLKGQWAIGLEKQAKLKHAVQGGVHELPRHMPDPCWRYFAGTKSSIRFHYRLWYGLTWIQACQMFCFRTLCIQNKKSVNLQYKKINWKDFCKEFCKKSWKKNNTWNITRLVDDSFVPSSKRPSVLNCKLTDF